MTEPRIASDADLILAFKRGDESAFDALFDHHRDSVYSLAYRTLGEARAEDATQDAFLQLYKSLSRFRGDSTFKTWLFRLTLNVCRDHIRRIGRQPVTCDLSDFGEGVGCEQQTPSGIASADLESALFDLPQDERSLLELHYVQGFTHREISEMLGCHNGSVRTRMHRAILKLRRRLLPVSEEAE